MNDLDKAVIVERLREARAAFEAVLAPITEAQMVGPPVYEAWTVKDIVAHITAWERECLGWLETAARGERPQLPAPGAWAAEIERFNAVSLADSQNRTLDEVMADFQTVYARFLAAMEALPADPTDDLWAVWQDSKPPWGLLETFAGHYREHGRQIQAWLADLRHAAG